MTTAINEITQNGTTTSKTDQVSARTIVLPNNFFAGYEALAARLAGAQPGSELHVYVAPQAEVGVTVKSVSPEQLPSPAGIDRGAALRRRVPELRTDRSRRTVTIDARSRLVRLEIPSAGLRLVRSDLAGVATRPQPVRNPDRHGRHHSRAPASPSRAR